MAIQTLPTPQNETNNLIALGRELAAAWTEEQSLPEDAADDEADLLRNATMAIIERVAAAPATNIEGLRVKALAVSICHAGDVDFGPETDCRIASSLVRELLQAA